MLGDTFMTIQRVSLIFFLEYKLFYLKQNNCLHVMLLVDYSDFPVIVLLILESP